MSSQGPEGLWRSDWIEISVRSLPQTGDAGGLERVVKDVKNDGKEVSERRRE
jgi:hypothetical protein